jgi:hypothetical protein
MIGVLFSELTRMIASTAACHREFVRIARAEMANTHGDEHGPAAAANAGSHSFRLTVNR